MSLTEFVALPGIKQRLSCEFTMPAIMCRGPMRVTPCTKSYGLTGTAFDYLLRFWLRRVNPAAEIKSWVAEAAVRLLERSGSASVRKTANKILEEAKQIYSEYLKTGEMTDKVIRTTVCLAQLDPIYRAEYIDPNLGIVEQLVIDELRELFSLVPPNVFKARTFCALNPTFGEASLLVGGADADIVIDDLLIDVKTIQSGRLNKSHFHQLVGYYILTQLGGINGNQSIKIHRLGVFYSRYGELLTFPSTLLCTDKFPELVKWFKIEAAKIYGDQLPITFLKSMREQ